MSDELKAAVVIAVLSFLLGRMSVFFQLWLTSN